MKNRLNRIATLVVPGVALLICAEMAVASARWDMNGCNPTSLSTSCATADGAKLSAYSSGTTATSTISTAYVGAWNLSSKFGNGETMRDVGVIANTSNDASSPQHSMDNKDYYDSLVLSFSGAVNLTEVQLGWRYFNGSSYGDTDLSVLAYTGKGTANPASPPVLTGMTYAQLLTSGWELVGNYNNVWNASGQQTTTSDTQNRVALGTAIFSSYWLVAAYNQVAFNSSGKTASGANWDTNKDYVKLLAVYGDKKGPDSPPSQVPEPSSGILLGLGLIGVWSMRRRAREGVR